MPLPLPPGAPATLNEAFTHFGTIQSPTVDDLKFGVLLEAAGQALYKHMASCVTHSGVQDLLLHNGREEMAHAHRLSKAIHALTGESYPPPAPQDNPYLQGPPMPAMDVTADSLIKLSDAEFGGDALYARWAASTTNAEAAELMRQNGKEESDHGNRLLEAARLLSA